jgi:type I restriction enzyme S subunit
LPPQTQGTTILHYFLVHLDYETSERAGAGGMFQVISIEDAEGNDKTNLVDQGTHYHDLAGLTADLAKALGVPASEIDVQEDVEGP